MGLPQWLKGKESTCSAGDSGLIPGLGRSPGEEKWQLTPVFLPGKIPIHGVARVGYNWMTKQQTNFPGGVVDKNPPANTGDYSLIPALGGSFTGVQPWQDPGIPSGGTVLVREER